MIGELGGLSVHGALSRCRRSWSLQRQGEDDVWSALVDEVARARLGAMSAMVWIGFWWCWFLS